jgi:hypothetical protein
MKNFKIINSDMDYTISKRIFSGKITKNRYKILDRFCRKNSFRTNCGHEWDCCGCMCSQYMEFEYKNNQVILILHNSFNY